MNHKLEADSIQLAFNGRQILSSIYLKSNTNEITGLLGRNGQGKSCLMKIIHGTMVCERSVRINGLPQRELFKRPDLLRYLPQFNFIPKSLSLKRVFMDFGIGYQQFIERFPEFTLKYKSALGSLSGGERRLVELYVIVKSNSMFAMLDEPFTHLNPIQIEKVKALLLEEKSRKGFIVTDHMYREVLDICDNLYVLADGKVHLTQSHLDLETYGYVKL